MDTWFEGPRIHLLVESSGTQRPGLRLYGWTPFRPRTKGCWVQGAEISHLACVQRGADTSYICVGNVLARSGTALNSSNSSTLSLKP